MSRKGAIMADIFLMGTVGNPEDPNYSRWREPIKAACAAMGITYFDPTVLTWDEGAMRREAAAMASCRVIVMAIVNRTPAIAALAESGWAAIGTMQRKQAFGLYIELDYPGVDNEAESSRRARKLVNAHALELVREFPNEDLFVAQTLPQLTEWTIKAALRKKHQAG